MPSGRRRRPWSLIIIVLVALLSLSYTIVTDNRPFLGLDLQGGVSVVLQPAKKNVSSDTLNEAIAIINNRINSFGVSEAQVSRQGNNILVEIPGVKDKDRALALVGQTAELQFRPVLGGPIPAGTKVGTTTTTAKGATSTTAKGATTTTVKGASTTTTRPAGTTTTTAASTSTTQKALGVGTTATTRVHAQLTAASSTTTTAKGATTTTAKGATTTTAKGATTTTAGTTTITATPDAELAKPSSKTQPVVLPELDPKTRQPKQYWYLGPVALTGTSLSTASSDLSQQGQWEIRPVFKSGKDGIDKFNAIAAICYAGSSSQVCPTLSGASHGQIAIVLDNKVLAAPTIDAASFQRDQITISGNFTQSEASDIATALKYGALPVVLKQATAEIVSATLGKDALHAGLVAGIIAFFLVGLYMIGFYRILGGLAMLKLVIEGCIMWGFLCWAGPHLGLALTLAGITGIIVSIGVSLDSNVVYYEHLKEDVRAGRTIRASVDKSFASAWSTILAADFASIIGAALLYYLTVGAVRGFAFYLGLSTILDLITSWCYMRPAVAIATRSKMCQEHPHRFGLPTTADVAEAAVASQQLVAAGSRR
jgi:preprotein translocase subunit SecD